MPPLDAIIQQKINQIEAEMKRIGLWQKNPPTPDQLNFTQAFGGASLPFVADHQVIGDRREHD